MKKKEREKVRERREEDISFIRDVIQLTNVSKIARDLNIDPANVIYGRTTFDNIERVRVTLEENLKTLLGIDENENSDK